ncbi:MAG: LamG domain-containing protein, partial [Chloroflexi bacterium]|nr:LamG domain-containing protein [Chloroflexota bacterium]
TVLKRTFTFANTGFLDLLTYVSAPAGLTVSQTGSRRVGPADMTTYEIALNAADLPVGPYDQTITIRTSDPNNPTRTVHVMGTITTATPDTSPGALQRPLDWPAAISGNQGDWVEFTHTLGPEPQTLHPVKVYSQDYSSLKGIGKYATAFGSGLPWWNFNYQYRRQISVRANTATPANYPVKLTLDTNSLQSSGKVRADRADWRVVYWTGSTWVELDRYAAAVDQTWFPTAVALNAGSVDSNYFVYYGYPSESQVPPANPARVFPAGTDAATAVSYYFLEGTGSTSADYSPTGAPFVGLGENAVWAVPSGRYRGGLYLTGNGCRNGWISPNTVPNVASITIEIWVYPTLVDGQERWLLGKGNEADHYQYALIQNAGNRWQVGITDNQSYWRTWWDTGVAVAPNAWSHLAFTYDSATGNLRFYLNGVLMAASNAGWSGSLAMTNYAFLFGNLYNLNHPYPETCNRIWRGYVSNLRISGIVRTDFSYAKLSPTTDPSSEVTGEQGVYVVEQVESAPYDRARLNLPEPGSHTYQVQYGRKLNWGGAANQVTSLRVPAGLFTSATLQALVSGLPSNAWFALDVGNTGSDSWNGTVGNGGEYTSPNLAAFFNAYWANHGAPTTGYLDVPVRVYLDRAGQVLLTNLQMIPSGSKLRYVRLPVQNYSNVSANFTVDRLFFDDFSAQVPGRWTVAA